MTATDDPDAAAPSEGTAGFGLDLPEHGTGIRAARRAARAEEEARQRFGRRPAPSRWPASAPPTQPPSSLRPLRAEPSDATPVAAEAVRTGPSRRWLIGFTAILAISGLAAAVLAFVGVQTLRDSRVGRTVTSAAPDEPGFEGLLEPTPTLVVLHEHDGGLASVALLALGRDDRGGSVMLIPPDTLVGAGNLGTLAVAYAFAPSLDDVRGAVEIVAGVGIEEAIVVDDARWGELVGPVAPLAFDNPDRVAGFDTGRIELAPDEVGAWLTAADADENETARLYRQQLFYETWLAAVAAVDRSSAVPGELDAGIGRFVRGLAAGTSEVAALPVQDVTDPDGNPAIAVDRAAALALVPRLVPYPSGTPNAPRTLVRLLDGSGDGDHVTRVAPTVIAADSSVVVVGNADSFEYTTTEIRYHRPEGRAAADRIRAALGAGRVIEDVRPIDSFDVTIVLGTDL